MGHIFLKSSVLSFTGYAIYRVVENSAPTVEITRQSFAAPHPERGVTFSPLNPVMHQVQLWESLDGTSLDTLRVTLDIDASINNEMQFTLIEFVVDRGNPGLVPGDTGDPVAGTDEYLDARMLKGLTTNYSIVQRGVGPLRSDEYIDDTVHGGFTLTGGNTFFSGDTFWVTVFAATTVQTPAAVGELDVIIVSTDLTLDNTHYGKLIIANAGGDTQILTFPLFSTIPDKTRMSFSAQYGTYKYLELECDTGDSIKFNNADKIALFLSRDERIELIWKSGFCYIVFYEGQAKQRGKIYGDYYLRPGTLQADGTEYTKDELTGFWDWLINDAPTDAKTTYALWNAGTVIGTETVYTHKGLFAVDLVGETFKVPDLSGMSERYLLAGDITRTPALPGGYQHSALEEHYHNSGHEGSILKGVAHSIEKALGAGAGNTIASGISSTGGVINRTDDATVGINIEETRVKNIGKIPLVIL